MTARQVATSTELRHSRTAIVAQAVEIQRARWPGLFESFDEDQMDKVIQDTEYHLDFLTSALWAGEQVLFDDYVAWVKILFVNLGLPIEWLVGSLEDLCVAVSNSVTPQLAGPAVLMVDASLESLESYGTDHPSFIEPDQPLGGLALRYLSAVLGADRHAASRMVIEAVESGSSVADIYTYVFQRTQLELGRLWQTNAITVAQEHLATAVTQLVMSQLYSYVFDAEKRAHTLVASCVGGELHEIGMRMVADVFEMAHWDTHYVGANTPAGSLVETVARTGADVLALSATMTYNVPRLAEVVSRVKADPRTSSVSVLVGGYPFNLAPDLWHTVGADGWAPDARSAIEVATRLTSA